MQSLLNKYLNSGILSRHDAFFSLLWPELPYRINAHKCIVHDLSEQRAEENAIKFHIPPYIYKHKVVIKIADYLRSTLYDDLAGAYAHGSVATGEIIAYSDFDGLLIVKDHIVADKARLLRLARHLRTTRTMMLEFDPLQHHGWLILTESDLHNYDDAFFPSVLFDHMACLLDKGSDVSISISKRDHKTVFNEYIIKFKAKTKRLPGSIYGIKSLLSEFMLLPSLYIQAKTGMGVFKKDSFIAASADFNQNEWQVMTEVSGIRERWDYKLDIKRELAAFRFAGVKPLSAMIHTTAPDNLSGQVLRLLPHMKSLADLMLDKISSSDNQGDQRQAFRSY